MDVTTEALRELLLEAGVDRAVAEAVRPDVPLLRQGVDSLEYPAFCLAVEGRFGLVLDDRAALTLRTLDDFAAVIRRNGQAPEGDPIDRILRGWKDVAADRPCEVGPLRPGDGRGIAQLFYAIYGDRYPVKDYYDPERIERMNREGSLFSVVARLDNGDVVGQGAYYQSSAPNKALFEFGQVMIAPEYRNSRLAALIPREMERLSRTLTQAQGFFGEAVCTHLVTQKFTSRHGYSECGLEVALMPAGAYEKEGAGSRRVSCLLGARVDKDRPMPLHLPACYRREADILLKGFTLDRDIRFGSCPPPAGSLTRVESRTFDTAQVERIQVLSVGADFPEKAAELDLAVAERGLAVLQVFLNTGLPETPFAVEALRARGFFLGGLIPLWFGPDGLLMQKLSVDPEFETINLHADKARAILDIVRADFHRARATA